MVYTEPMKRFLFIRHGQTDENLADMLHVHSKNESGLNNIGRQQILKTAEICRVNHVEVIFSSPEKRAVESAEIIVEALHLSQPIILPDLLERDWGDWEGKSWKTVESLLDTFSLEKRYTFLPPHGESWKQMDTRLKNALEILLDRKEKVLAVVTHGGVLRALMPLLLDSPKEISFRYHFDNASVTMFDYDKNFFKQVNTDASFLHKQE